MEPYPGRQSHRFAPAVCSKLRQGAASALVVSTSCSTKTEAIPPCGPWSAVLGNALAPISEAGTTPPPTAHLLGALRPDGGAGLPCCPLMIDGAKNIFTCVCPSAENATLLSIGLPAFSVAPALTLAQPASRPENLYFAAAVQNGTVFSVDAVANSIARASLQQDAPAYAPLVVKGEITEATPLLVDQSSMYILASAVTGATGAPVQLVKVDRASGRRAVFRYR